jgi:hypothetical protein
MSISETVQDYIEFAQAEPVAVAIILVVLFVWFASGCFSSSIAEDRMHNPWVHFALGLVIPVIYPLIILFALNVKVPKDKIDQAKKEAAVEHIDGPPPPDMLPPAAIRITDDSTPGLIDPEMLATKTSAFNEAYFKQHAVDSMGKTLGPYIITVGGEELRAERIVEVLPKAVVIEIASSGGKAQTLRIPYEKVENCIEVHD